MKKQTAVEFFQQEIIKIINGNSEISENEIYLKAKEIEREQIINAYDAGTFYLEGALYYKETFEDESGI